ncbi:O-methyltransferase [Paenibacillus sp. MBLB4367]|uniref:O-methyltransferase n=1 Tax=Paenibacillus sp. MBLB4367 TaxID=3384767 RepID=UPI00390805F7
MYLEQLPLTKQLEVVFREVKEELSRMTSGVVFVQIRNNIVGKFGCRHYPVESKGGLLQVSDAGLSETHLQSFRKMAMEALRHKHHWTHGEIVFEFALKQNTLHASVQFESNYNMATLFVSKDSRKGVKEKELH